MEAKREWVFGECRAYFEEPDLLIVHPGRTSLEVARFLTGLYRELGTQRPLFLVVTIAGLPLTMEARGYFRQHLRSEWFRSVFFIGAGIMDRAMGKALHAGGVFIRAWTVPIHYVETEAEARAGIAGLRAKQEPPPA